MNWGEYVDVGVLRKRLIDVKDRSEVRKKMSDMKMMHVEDVKVVFVVDDDLWEKSSRNCG